MLSARSISEARLYIELRSCGDCGGSWTAPLHRLNLIGGRPVAVDTVACFSCGRQERFEFLLPTEVETASGYGGADSSQIVDAGEFLWASDHYADLAFDRRDAATPQERAAVAELLKRSVNALEEVLKFVPGDADRVPLDDITSDRGRSLYGNNPDRFRAGHVEAELLNLCRLWDAYGVQEPRGAHPE
ncbi:hypothetical protein ABZ635_13815 [Nocardiopsis sp. NPDC007018]|uniref:hypothetical protein n=1 Tax=Nocardiopsis sp. NPDC007018 TaxID=3155721 RepID=UPI0033E141B9